MGSDVKVGKEKVKEMVMSGGGGWEVVSICGTGGHGTNQNTTTIPLTVYIALHITLVCIFPRHMIF
jgi:hypothetical protein